MKKLNGVISYRLEVWYVFKEPSDQMVIAATKLMRPTSSGPPASTAILDTLTLFCYSPGVLHPRPKAVVQQQGAALLWLWRESKGSPRLPPCFRNRWHFLVPVCDCWPAASLRYAAETQDWLKMLTSSFVPLGVKWRKISLQRRLLFWNCLTSSAEGISCLRWCENVWLQRSALVGPGRGCRRSSRRPPECHAHYSIHALYTTLVHTDTGGHISHTHTASHRWSRGLCERCCSQQFLGDGLLLGPGVASHQTLCFWEELCVWPDNSAFQTFNFPSVWVCESLFFVQEHHDEHWPLVNFCHSGIPSCLWSPLFYFLWSNSIFFYIFYQFFFSKAQVCSPHRKMIWRVDLKLLLGDKWIIM